jgi:7-cyano-7-deazaguanine synthase
MLTNKKPSIVVPISGGMDSTVLLHKAACEYSKVHAVSFNYGQKHKKELMLATYQVDKIKEKIGSNNITYEVIDIPFFKDIANTSALTNNDILVARAKDVMGDPQTVNYIPFRNLMLISICLAYAESHGVNVVWHGAAQADSIAGYWDGSEEFISQLNKVSDLNRRIKISVEAPLLTKSKMDIVIMGMHLGVDFAKTWTCYEGEDEACGECTACSLRLQGFIKAGYIDPLPYKKEIDWNSYNCIPLYS